jgi:IS4 transposase
LSATARNPEKYRQKPTGFTRKRKLPFIRKSRMATISYCLVKVILPTGETEVLMTDLDKSFTINELAELYRLRWGIETAFFCLKSHQMLGTFSGYSEQVILQDIWCNVLFYNLQSITNLEANLHAEQMSQKRKNKPSKRKQKANGGYQIILQINCFSFWNMKIPRN